MTTQVVPDELREKWVAALRSGEYKQGRKLLMSDFARDRRYCCLGVLCVVGGIDEGELYGLGLLSSGIIKKLNLRFDFDFAVERDIDLAPGQSDRSITGLQYASSLNDSYGFTFPQIADLVEHFKP